MRLLIASSSPPDGGAGISAYARTLSAALASDGHEIHYASPSPENHDFLDEHGMRHVPTDRDEDPMTSASRLLEYVRSERIDGFINNDNPVLQSIAPALEAPLVVVCHMDRRIVASLCTLHRDWIDHLVCISNDMHRTMVRRYKFESTRCRLIHNGTRDPGHSGSFEPRDPERLRIVCTGGWNRDKGGPRTMQSILRHQSIWKEARVDWFGGVPDQVRKKASDLPSIHFRGQVSQGEFHDTLRAADVLVFGSSKEGCPMTMLEAMSFGVVPIATNGVGAMRWLIDTGREGFICHLDDWSRQLSAAIEFLQRNTLILTEMKKSARARFLRDFRAETNAERILSLVEQPTVDRSRPGRRFDVVRWHRPVATPDRSLTLLERIRYRTGWLDRISGFEASSTP